MRPAVVLPGILCVLAACSSDTGQARDSGSLAVFEAYVRAWNARDTTAIDTLLAADGVHEDLAQRFRGVGAAQVNAFLRGLLQEEPDFQWQITSTFADGSHVSAEWTWTATYSGPSPSGPVTNLRITGRGSSVAEVSGGKITRFTDYYDTASFFPAAPADTTRR